MNQSILKTKEEISKFEAVFSKYNKILYKFSYNILKDSYMAEDAVQEAFIKVAYNLIKIQDINSNKTMNFLVTIVKNVSLTMYKKKKGCILFIDEELSEEIVDESINLEDSMIAQLDYDHLLHIIGYLKDELKSPFLLRYVHDCSDKEIADILDITQNNVTVRIHRSKAKLRKILERNGITNE